MGLRQFDGLLQVRILCDLAGFGWPSVGANSKMERSEGDGQSKGQTGVERIWEELQKGEIHM